jgi:hypothetical protein
MSYDSQPAGNIPLNCNRYQPGFPTLATSVSIKPLRSNGRVWFPCCDGVRFPSRPVLQIGKRSLHTGEVVGSIPTAPTILRAYLPRGIITTGKLVHDSDRLYGRGLIDAYNAERHNVIDPRIAVDERVMEELRREFAQAAQIGRAASFTRNRAPASSCTYSDQTGRF